MSTERFYTDENGVVRAHELKAVHYNDDDPIPISDTTAYYLGLSTDIANLEEHIEELKRENAKLKKELGR